MRFITADRLFNGRHFLPGKPVLVLNANGSLKEISDGTGIDQNKLEHLKGTLSPGFINAHCHLELSHLKNKIATHTGLPAFGKEIMKQRNLATAEEVQTCMQQADEEMQAAGIVAVGDISNTSLSLDVKKNSRIYYHTFVELIGLDPQRSEAVFSAGLALLNMFKSAGLDASLAPHAPYSTSNELIDLIAQHTVHHNSVLSIHNQESPEEDKFFKGAESDFHELYRFLNLDISWFKAPGTSSLKNYGNLLPANASMLVHNTFTGKDDIDFVAAKNNYWCFCPGANLYIENTLPDYALFKRVTSQLCLGTDSLASNTQLNLLAEANLLSAATTLFSDEERLAMLCYNGAKALGIETDFGAFIPGKNAGINLLDIKDREFTFVQKIA